MSNEHAAQKEALHSIWRDLAEKRIEHGVDWPGIARSLFRDLDQAAVAAQRRDKELADYLREMDRAGGGVYTADFREGFRHALAMLAAYEEDAR